jgi:hypothetical protein
MLRIFKSIRQKLASENKAMAYLRYAIGEIILVVIGILIALQVNNWNENRKFNQRIRENLKAIQVELSLNISRSGGIIDQYMQMDSIKNLIFKNQITYNEYKNSPSNNTNLYIANYYYAFIVNTIAYNNLTQIAEEIPQKYSPVLDQLNHLYIRINKAIDSFNQRYRSTVYKNVDYWYKEKPNWAVYDDFNGETSDGQINFLLNNIQYKSQIARSMNDMKNVFMISCLFRKDAIDTYLAIADILENKDETPGNINYTLKNDKLTDQYVGKYKLVYGLEKTSVGNEIDITKNKNQLFVTTAMDNKAPMYYYKNSIFFLGYDNNLLCFDSTGNGKLNVINGKTDMIRFKKRTDGK